MTEIEIELLFLSALESSHGIVVSTNDSALLKQRLYSYRAKARKDGILTYDSLTFRTSPIAPESELWIVLGDNKDGPA